MPDLTLIYYSACRIPGYFAVSIRTRLRVTAYNLSAPIISVTLRPVHLGKNICIGDREPSTYWIYWQILVGAMDATTRYVACCEDDCIYNLEHFSYRPPPNTFAYNINRWNAEPSCFYKRNRAGMCMCIVERDYLVRTLTERFSKFYVPFPGGKLAHFGEPGRRDNRLEKIHRLQPVAMQTFETACPTLTFNHADSIGGRRAILPDDVVRKSVEPWGDAEQFWKDVHG